MNQPQAGKDLVMAGYMALAGSAVFARQEADYLARWLPRTFLEETKDCYEKLAKSICALPQRLPALAGAKEAVCFALGQGGLFNGLWEMARIWQTEFTIELKAVPVRQETIEICERLEINPYYLCSENSFLIAAPHGERLCRACREQGWPAAVIGTLDRGKKKQLLYGGRTGCLNRPQADEQERFLQERAARRQMETATARAGQEEGSRLYTGRGVQN